MKTTGKNEDIGTRLISDITKKIKGETRPSFAPLQELWGRVFRLPENEKNALLKKTAEESPELFYLCRDEIAWHFLIPGQKNSVKEIFTDTNVKNSPAAAFSLACSPLMDRFSRSSLAAVYGENLRQVLPRFLEMRERLRTEAGKEKIQANTEKQTIGILRACFSSPQCGRELLPLDKKTLGKLLGMMTSMLKSLENSDSFERTEALSLCRRFLALHGEHTAPEKKPWREFLDRRNAVEEAEKETRQMKKMEICI